MTCKEIMLALNLNRGLRFDSFYLGESPVGLNKGTVVPVHAVKANRGDRGTAPLILDTATSWWRAGSLTRRPFYPVIVRQYPLNRGLFYRPR